jgi:DNA-repair protein complementing XP-A cells
MMLFLRYQVEEYAFKVKWGSQDALDAEYEKRVADKKNARQKKFEKGLRDLRRRTKESIWQARKDEEHVHEFGALEKTGMRGEGIQRCVTCGFEVEVEEL